jgi:RNA polymerase-binding transcription factor DksA
MTLQQSDLIELKNKLASEKVRLEEELNRIGKPTTDSGDFSTNFNEIGTDEDDNASEVEEYTDNLALEATLEKQLKEILDAIEKIDTSAYGKCEKCNANIPIERLMAYPAAKTCTAC